MKLTHFFGSGSAAKESGGSGKGGKKKTRSGAAGKSSSFGSTASSSSSDDVHSAVTTPRTVLPPASAAASSSSSAPATKMVAAPVTRGELEVALRRVVATEEELAAALAEDPADQIALALAEVTAAAADEGELREAFAVFDADGDGRISAEELGAVLAALGDEHRCSAEDCRRMIGGVDADGDGFVCFDEFSRMMTTAMHHAP
ncbi:probable calcium-binding protein CML35 [Brachypodium distachyon]|uniref:probable calcium-binding protein CML35 n=1 Tax=Brachypodium distachyon TaxID=15368 RepID=UPI0001C7173C|nr:probable calcium-binding protein CML35 [Brachypodium distachyon]|eukprot:XP_003577074.1 probable calcium-binding protein CML35 [Brachypodium distachyon]